MGSFPLTLGLLLLAYLKLVRGVFDYSLQYHWIVYFAAVVLMVGVAWRGLCQSALMVAVKDIAVGEPRPFGAYFRLISQRAGTLVRVTIKGLIFPLVAVLIPLLFIYTETSEEGKAVLIVLFSFFISIPLLLFSVLWSQAPATAVMEEINPLKPFAMSRRSPPGTYFRQLSINLLYGVFFLIYVTEIYLVIQLVLFLAEILFHFRMAYWYVFFSINNAFYVVLLLLVVMNLLDGLRGISRALLWLDTRIRRDAMDLRMQIEKTLPRAFVEQRSLGRKNPPNLIWLISLGIGCLLGITLTPQMTSAQERGPRESDVIFILQIVKPMEVSEDGFSNRGALTKKVGDLVYNSKSDEEEIYWSWIQQDLFALNKASGDEAKALLGTIQANLEMTLKSIKAFEDTEKSGISDTDSDVDADVTDVLKGILARDEFSQVGKKKLKANSKKTKKKRQIKECTKDCSPDRKQKKSTHRSGGLGGLGGGFFKILFYGAMVVGLGVLLFVIISMFKNRVDDDELTLDKESDSEQGRVVDALSQTPAQWRAQADRLAAAGDYREAVRALYLSLLVTLHRKRIIAYDRTRTNWEYLATFPYFATSLQPPFETLTIRFDHIWYGHEVPNRDDYDRCVVLSDSLLEDVRPPESMKPEFSEPTIVDNKNTDSRREEQ